MFFAKFGRHVHLNSYLPDILNNIKILHILQPLSNHEKYNISRIKGSSWRKIIFLIKFQQITSLTLTECANKCTSVPFSAFENTSGWTYETWTTACRKVRKFPGADYSAKIIKLPYIKNDQTKQKSVSKMEQLCKQFCVCYKTTTYLFTYSTSGF